MAEEKEYFNQDIRVNGNRELKTISVGCSVEYNGTLFDQPEYIITDNGTKIKSYIKKHKQSLDVSLNGFLITQAIGDTEKEFIATEANEMPINTYCQFTSVDDNVINSYLKAGIYSYVYRIYNSLDSAKKEVIDASLMDKKILNSQELKELSEIYKNGRSAANDDVTPEEEDIYLKSVLTAYKSFENSFAKYRKELAEELVDELGDIPEDKKRSLPALYEEQLKNKSYFENLNNLTYYRCEKGNSTIKDVAEKVKSWSPKKFFDNDIIIKYKYGQGDKEGKNSESNIFYHEFPMRSCEIMYAAFCASKAFYDFKYTTIEITKDFNTFKFKEVKDSTKDLFKVGKNYILPSSFVEIYAYKSSDSNLQDELLNKNNKGSLKTIEVDGYSSVYNPYSYDTFENGWKTTKRSNLKKILIHYTGGGGSAEGAKDWNDSQKSKAANFYVDVNVGAHNASSAANICMSIPHEYWPGSIGVSESSTDRPYSNDGDENRANVRRALAFLKQEFALKQDVYWDAFKNSGFSWEETDGKFLGSFDTAKFKEQAGKEWRSLCDKYNWNYLDKDGIPKENDIKDTKNFSERLNDNNETIAIEMDYGVGSAGGTPDTSPYSTLYGGMWMVKKGAFKAVQYLVKYLFKHYGKDSSCLMRHFDHSGKSCPYGFIGDSAWNYLKMYIGGLGTGNTKNDLVNVSKEDFNSFVAKYTGEKGTDEFDSAVKFAERWNGINSGTKKMEYAKYMEVLTNGTFCKIEEDNNAGIIHGSDGDKVGDQKDVIFRTLRYSGDTPKEVNGEKIPAQTFYYEKSKVKFFDNCRLPKKDEKINARAQGDEMVKDSNYENGSGEDEEKKVSINQVRSFINKWICVDKAGADNNQNVSQGNSAADDKGGPQQLLDVQNYYDFLSGMTPKIQARFRGISQDKKKANWIGLDSLIHPYFESLNIKDTGVKQATLTLYDKDFASYQLGIITYKNEDKRTIYSLEQIIKQAIGTCVIAKAETNKLYNTKDYDNAEISDDFLTFKESEDLGPANLRLRWGYADYNLKTTYRQTLDAKGNVIGYHYAEAGKEGASTQQERLTEWERQLNSSVRTNRWWEVEWQDDKDTFQVSPSKYIVSPGVAAEQTPGQNGGVTLKNSSDRLNGEEGVNVSRDVLMKSENSTCLITPWIDFMIVGLKTELTKTGLRYVITAIESKDGEVLKTRFLQKYAQISTYPEEVLYILMSIFNENPISGEVRKKSKIKLLLYKEKSDPRAFINNELDFSNMPEDLRQKFEDFTDTYTMDNATPQLQLSEVELEKYLKKITLSFGSADALKANYQHEDSKDRPNLYKSVAALMNEFCAACPPRKEKQMEPVTTDEGMVVKADTTGEAARPLKWFTCKKPGDNETTYVVLYYRRALRPRKIRSYIWGPHNPYQSCVKNVTIENANEFAVLAGIEAFNEKSEKETKLKYARSDVNGNQGVFGQGMVDVKRSAEKKLDEKKMDEGESANYIFTDIKSRNNYQEAYSNSVYQGSIEILGDPFYTFDGLMQPCTYPIRLDVLIPFNGFHSMRGGESMNSQFEDYDSKFNTFYDDGTYGNQRRHEISGYYVIKAIEHNISPGKFTTKLDVISYPQIEEQILDKKDGKPIFPKFKDTKRHANK